jgi:hypothetical protein
MSGRSAAAAIKFVPLTRDQVHQLRNLILDDDAVKFEQLCREFRIGGNDSVYFMPGRASRRSSIVGTLDSDVCVRASGFPRGKAAGAAGAGVGAALPLCLPIHLAVLNGSRAVLEWLVRQQQSQTALSLSVPHWSGRNVFELARDLPDDLQTLLLGGVGGVAGQQRVLVADFETALQTRQQMRELQLGSGLHLLLCVARVRVVVLSLVVSLSLFSLWHSGGSCCCWFRSILVSALWLLLLPLSSPSSPPPPLTPPPPLMLLPPSRYVVLTIYACSAAAPWITSNNAPVFLRATLDEAPFNTTAFDGQAVPFTASFGDIYSVRMFAHWFEQVLLPTLQAAQQNNWVQPDTSGVQFLFGARVRQLRVLPQSTAPFTCGCVDPALFLSGAAAGAPGAVCYPPWNEQCVDMQDINLTAPVTTTSATTVTPAADTKPPTEPVTVAEYLTAQESSLSTAHGYVDNYFGGGNFLDVNENTLKQALEECGSDPALMGDGCLSPSVFDTFVDNLLANAPALRLVQVRSFARAAERESESACVCACVRACMHAAVSVASAG